MKIGGTALTGLVTFGALLAPGGGSPALAADAAATVNGTTISVDELQDTLEELGAAGTVTGEQARTVLTEMITNEAVRQALVAAGVDPEASADESDADTPAVIADRSRYAELLGETGAFDVDALREEYESSASAGGLMCLRLFVVEDVDAGDEAMDDLDNGAEFADVAAEHDPNFATTGGSVTGDPNALCFDAAGLSDAAAPIVDAVTEAGAGQPVGPIETDIATVVAMAPPFEEVSGELDNGLVEPAIDDIVAAADVTVGARYGRWDPATGSVVPLGQP